MVARSVLTGFQLGSIGKTVGRTSGRLTIQAVTAAVGLAPVKPHKPGAALETDGSDLAGRERRCRAGSIGAGRCEGGGGGGFSLTFAQLHLEGLAQVIAIGGMVNELDGEILFSFHIEARCISRSFRVAGLGNGCNFISIRRLALKIQKNHIIRKNDFRRASVGGILDLRQQRNYGVIFTGFPSDRDDQIISVQCLGIQMGVLPIIKVGYPLRNRNMSRPSGNGQAHTADITACRGVRQIAVEHLGDLGKIRRITRTCVGGVFHSKLHGSHQSSE